MSPGTSEGMLLLRPRARRTPSVRRGSTGRSGGAAGVAVVGVDLKGDVGHARTERGAGTLLALQRAAGNRAVARRVAPRVVQPPPVSPAPPSGRAQVQRVRVGTQDVRNVDDLAPLLGLTAEDVLRKFNEALGNFPAVDTPRLNAFLNRERGKVRASWSLTDVFFRKLASTYKRTYFQSADPAFDQRLGGISQEQRYQDLMAPDGYNYADGVDDGASVKDEYDVALACSLFALLKARPGFLGAGSARELHQIFRSHHATRKYDNDREVAKIRLSAGLHYWVPGQSTVSDFTRALRPEHAGRVFIIDPKGEAHTFALVHSGGKWKSFDNDNQGGALPPNCEIRMVWSEQANL